VGRGHHALLAPMKAGTGYGKGKEVMLSGKKQNVDQRKR